MPRTNQLSPKFVDFIPERLEAGVIYISKRYSTATHLCCCGCGMEVVTPLNPAKWHLTEKRGRVSLYPSIGNWSFPCQAHYWIIGNSVHWAEALTPEMINAVKQRDLRDTEAVTQNPEGLFARFTRWIINFFSSYRA